MKVLCSLCVIITAVSAFHWTHKRNDYGQGEGGPDCTDSNDCWRLYKPINRVIRDPSFNVLIGNDGRLDLDCSESTRRASRVCGDDISYCARAFTKGQLYVAWDHFCQNKEEVEKLKACWNSPMLVMAIASCAPTEDEEDNLNRIPACIEREVTSLDQCGKAGGRLLRELIDKLLAEYF